MKFFNQYSHNIDFLKAIEAEFPGDYYDWKCTVIYYCALHLVKHHFRDIDLKKHEQYWQILQSRYDDKDLAVLYRSLFDKSRQSRYNGLSDSISSKSNKILYESARKEFHEFEIKLRLQTNTLC